MLRLLSLPDDPALLSAEAMWCGVCVGVGGWGGMFMCANVREDGGGKGRGERGRGKGEKGRGRGGGEKEREGEAENLPSLPD